MLKRKQRAILWLEGEHFPMLSQALSVMERNGELKLLGITGDRQRNMQWGGKTVPYIPMDKIFESLADYVIVSSGSIGDHGRIARYLETRGIKAENILFDLTICVPGFSIEKYRQLQQSCLSIISIHCAGGILAYRFGIPRRSPFVNLFWKQEDFLAMLEADPRESLQGELILKRTAWEENLQFYYPVFDLNGFEIHMNHYCDAEEGKRLWRERLSRMNWYNLLVMMYTDRKEILERFDKLPFAKKVCFVPFESNLASAYSVCMDKYEPREVWECSNAFAGGGVPCPYDLWDMMLYGKKTKL